MEKKISNLTVNEFRSLISETVYKALEELYEDILALSSSEYLASIKEARKDLAAGKVNTFKGVFDA